MNGIFDIAGKIATPLALAGFFGAALFFTLRRILQAHFLPTVRRPDSVRILFRIINLLFILCLAGMILGFAGYVLRLRADAPGTDFTNSPERLKAPILDAKLLLRIGGLRINVLNSGSAPATAAYVDVVSWSPGAPGPNTEKTIPVRDLASHADFTFDVNFLNPYLDPDYKDRLPTCGYIAVSCIGASRPRAWAFYIPNTDDDESTRKFFEVDPWPMIEFRYPEDKPYIGSCVDYPKGVCRHSQWLWSAKDIKAITRE